MVSVFRETTTAINWRRHLPVLQWSAVVPPPGPYSGSLHQHKIVTLALVSPQESDDCALHVWPEPSRLDELDLLRATIPEQYGHVPQ